jgi:chromosome segregation ATPase
LDAEIALIEAELNHSNTIKHRQMEVSSVTKDIEQLDREISSIEIGLGASDADRRLDTVQEEYDSIQLQCKALRMKMDRANSDFKAKNEEISLLESKMRDYWTEKQRIELKIQEKQRLKKTMLDLQSENEKLSNNIREIDMQIGELPTQIEIIETNLRTAQAQASIEEDIITKDIQNLSSAISRISEVQKLIDR